MIEEKINRIDREINSYRKKIISTKKNINDLLKIEENKELEVKKKLILKILKAYEEYEE